MDNDRLRELLDRIGRRDESAFRELYKAFSRRIYTYALNMVKDHGRAEEILVDTMHEVWRAPSRSRGDSQFGTWLIGIARNKALMVYRSRRPDEVHDDLDDIAETTAADTPDGFAQLAAKQRSFEADEGVLAGHVLRGQIRSWSAVLRAPTAVFCESIPAQSSRNTQGKSLVMKDWMMGLSAFGNNRWRVAKRPGCG